MVTVIYRNQYFKHLAMKKIFFICSYIGLLLSSVNAQLVVTPSSNSAQITNMVNNFILSGVTASNVSYTGEPYTLGSFANGNTTNLGLSNGIVMTTGSLYSNNLSSPVSSYSSTTNGGAGCIDLDNILLGSTTYDASVLEFDLVPIGNVLEFQYVFASEEYPEYVCSTFNDIFAFFISGPNPSGGNYFKENIAIIPGTNLPVSINTINNGTAGVAGLSGGCASLAYSFLYIDNEALNGQKIVFDGFTVVMLAKLFVTPSETYHLKMAIADVGDYIYDSGIFLKSQSMKSYNSTTGISESDSELFGMFPNPATNTIEISLTQKSEITISNTQGQILKSFSASENHTSIDISGFASGIYFVKVQTANGIGMKKFVKE